MITQNYLPLPTTTHLYPAKRLLNITTQPFPLTPSTTHHYPPNIWWLLTTTYHYPPPPITTQPRNTTKHHYPAISCFHQPPPIWWLLTTITSHKTLLNTTNRPFPAPTHHYPLYIMTIHNYLPLPTTIQPKITTEHHYSAISRSHPPLPTANHVI